MGTLTKLMVGAAVVGGGYWLYKRGKLPAIDEEKAPPDPPPPAPPDPEEKDAEETKAEILRYKLDWLRKQFSGDYTLAPKDKTADKIAQYRKEAAAQAAKRLVEEQKALAAASKLDGKRLLAMVAAIKIQTNVGVHTTAVNTIASKLAAAKALIDHTYRVKNKAELDSLIQQAETAKLAVNLAADVAIAQAVEVKKLRTEILSPLRDVKNGAAAARKAWQATVANIVAIEIARGGQGAAAKLADKLMKGDERDQYTRALTYAIDASKAVGRARDAADYNKLVAIDTKTHAANVVDSLKRLSTGRVAGSTWMQKELPGLERGMKNSGTQLFKAANALNAEIGALQRIPAFLIGTGTAKRPSSFPFRGLQGYGMGGVRATLGFADKAGRYEGWLVPAGSTSLPGTGIGDSIMVIESALSGVPGCRGCGS